MNLFKKALVFTDLHFGLKNNSIIHNNDCSNYIDWIIKLAIEQDCDTCIFMGDFHHNRASLNLLTLDFSSNALERLNNTFQHFYFLPGNHDLYYKDRRDINSINWAKHLPNITIIDEWFSKDDVAIIPWLVNDDYMKVHEVNAKYVFGHFELPHFKMNANITMPDTGELQSSAFSHIEKVFSGHFHIRQKQKNIEYIGNCFPHNHSDDGDYDRGCMILEWDKEPIYYDWDDAPSYNTIKLSELLNNLDPQSLKANMYLKVIMDIDITYEESGYIKEKFIQDYNLRELSLIPSSDGMCDDLVDVDLKVQTVDEIVSENIININSDTYDTNLLLQIYQGL